MSRTLDDVRTRGDGRVPSRAEQLRTELDQEISADGVGAWSMRGACRTLPDPDVMFPVAEPGSAAYEQQVNKALAVCAVCPVRPACLEHALTVGEGHGVWGGLPAEQRRMAPGRRAA